MKTVLGVAACAFLMLGGQHARAGEWKQVKSSAFACADENTVMGAITLLKQGDREATTLMMGALDSGSCRSIAKDTWAEVMNTDETRETACLRPKGERASWWVYVPVVF